jgi:hypothetical protein
MNLKASMHLAVVWLIVPMMSDFSKKTEIPIISKTSLRKYNVNDCSGSSYALDSDAFSSESAFEIIDEVPNNEQEEVSVPNNQETNTGTNEERRGKKRVRNENKWQRNIRKRKKIAGQTYKSNKSKKIIKKRNVGEPCTYCRMKCNEKISGIRRIQVCRNF